MKKKSLLQYLLLLSFIFSETYNDRFLIYIDNSLTDFELNKAKELSNNIELNQFLTSNKVKKIEKWLPHANDKDQDGQIFLNRFYVLKLEKKSDMLDSLLSEVLLLRCVQSAEKMGVMKTEYQPNDPYYSSQWYLPNIKADLAFDLWDISNGELPGFNEENPIVVGVVDVGLDWDHPDLVGNMWHNLGEDIDGDGVVIIYSGGSWIFDPGDVNGIDDDGDGYIDNFIGYDVANNDNDPVPPSGSFDHGTMVAGCVSASTDNGVGIASVGWGIKIMGINCSTESLTVTDAADGFLAAAQMGADVINLSLGSMSSCGSWQNLVNVAYNNYGCIIVASSGNGGEDGWTNFDLHSPSSCENVISVTATEPGDQFDCWATAGSTVDISAPGSQIRTTDVGGGYTYTQGTSFSSPIVTGAAALLKSRYPNASNTFIEELIINNADPISAMNGSCQGTSLVGMLGSGRLNINSSIMAGDSLQGPGLYISDVNYLNDTDGDGVFNPGEQVKIKLVIGNEIGFLDAENVVVTISTEDERIAFLDNTISFSNPIVAGGSAFTLIDHFLVYAFEDVALGNVSCLVSLRSGLSEPYQITEFELDISLSLNQKGFPVGEMNIESSPIIIDLNGNGSKEIIFGDEGGNLNVYSSAGFSQFGYPFESGDKIRSSPAVADLDMDGILEVVFGSYDGKLYVLSPFGSVLSESQYPGDIVGSPALIDLDQDGDKEVVFTTQVGNSGSLYAIHHNGEPFQGFPVNIDEKMLAGPAAGDLESDGSPDIVIVTWDDNIYAVDNTGNIKEGFPVLSTNRFSVAPVLVDLDLDGDLEIIVGNDSGLLQVIDHNGQEIISYDVGDDIRGGISLADLDNNGSMEILFSGYDDFLHAWNPLENMEMDGWPIDLMSNSVSEPVTADLDNDGDLEVIAANKSGMFFIFHHDGTNFNGFPLSLNQYIESSPVVSDLDEDGDYEVAIGTSLGLQVFDIKSQKGEMESWKLHRGNTQRSGSLGYTVLSKEENTVTIPSVFSLKQNYPNPFNPVTKIDFTLAISGNVILILYDITGKKIKTLLQENISAGSYTYSLDGSEFSSGMYLYSIDISNNKGYSVFNQTRKLILMK